jgi:hypothetical protein
MRRMRTWGVVALLLGALPGCQEPSKKGQFAQLVYDLNILHTWDPGRKAQGHYPYDQIMGCPPEVDHALAAAVADERPTAIHDRISGRTALVGDVAFMMILERLSLKWEAFYKDGVFLSTQLPNPIFCLKWDPGARSRVRTRLLALLPPLDDE